MKLISLEIDGYKNLKKKCKFDFSNCSNYAALIGLNGSGKSNVLEAISLIFSHYYHGTAIDFTFSLTYNLRIESEDGTNRQIKLSNDKMKVVGIGKLIAKSKYHDYLPANVITSYSGEEMRLWDEVYLDSYADFFQDLKKQNKVIPHLLYLNKYSWEIALITLLCSDNAAIKDFLKDELNISEDVTVKFNIDEDKYGLFETNEALSLVRRLVDLQKDSKENTAHINEIRTLELNQVDNLDFTKKIFYYLFITSMPQRSEKVKTQKVINSINIAFNDLNVSKLSEGEKKLILVNCITKILADSSTLILLDEPDSHVHIERKKELKKLISEGDQFTVLTTHSPSLLNSLENDNVFILSNKTNDGVTVYPVDRQKHLSEISGGVFTLMNATLIASTEKDILLLEGTNDYNYLKEALKRFETEFNQFDFLIINCGGAGNVAAILEQSILPILGDNQLCICSFDEDGAGKKGIESVKDLLSEESQNVKCITHPRHTEFPEELKEFFMEDYFDVNAYKPLLNDQIQNGTKFKDFESMTKAKGIIERNYKNFDDTAYNNFKVLIREVLRVQNEFHEN
ncbi:MAG: AAA family ATPase [Reichenbachiella sp.]|uniref:AAA family ATPase n=1 Tax=Reichenbachiella sp. TaxID=2184521 RepID=UPI003267666C